MQPNQPNAVVNYILQRQISGIYPTQQPQTYQYLLQLYCVKQLPNKPYYITWASRLCEQCYNEEDEEEKEFFYENKIDHFICEQEKAVESMHCSRCDIRITFVREAWLCPQCVTRYLDLSAEDKEELGYGGLKTVSIAME